MINNKQHSKLTDEELLNKFYRTKDKYWLGIVLERYTLLLLGVAMKYLKDKDQAADAVQHTFMKALTKLPKENVENIKGWLYIVIRNHSLQSIKDSLHYNDSAILNNYVDESVNEKEFHEKEYTYRQMENALNELIKEQRICIKLFYYEKMSYQQITERTSYSFMQVKSYIQNGKRNLKNILLEKLDTKR